MEHHAFGVDVADLEAQAFAQAQAAGVDGAQADAVVQFGDVAQDPAHLPGREDDGQFELGIGPREVHFFGPGAAEGFFPEDFEGADGLRAGLAGYLLNLLEVDAVLAELLGGDQVGGFVVILAQLADARVVGALGAGSDGQELQVIGKRIEDGVRGTFFICMVLVIVIV